MSILRKLSFRKKAPSENGDILSTESVLSDKKNGDVHVELCTAGPDAVVPMAVVSEREETRAQDAPAEAETVAQAPEETNGEIVGNSLHSINTTEPREQTDSDLNEKRLSFAIPDGLAMDPMAPTALAVSNEFMDRIGSGLTLLRDHGKKLQKVGVSMYPMGSITLAVSNEVMDRIGSGLTLLRDHGKKLQKVGASKDPMGPITLAVSNEVIDHIGSGLTLLRDHGKKLQKEGVSKDPMGSITLAVSNEFMDRIGSGLTLLRDHGKKLQKVGVSKDPMGSLTPAVSNEVMDRIGSGLTLLRDNGKKLQKDPMGSLKLAVSNEVMDRIDSGLTLLRDNGKKLQKVGVSKDPMGSLKLAVSNEVMDRIDSGLTLLRDQLNSKHRKFEVVKRSWKSLVNVVLVDAKDLPDTPPGGSNELYCKFKLGSETHKSKQVSKSKSAWRERFNLHLYDDNNLEITVWHKGKQKNFMGRCTIDLSQLEKEKTHELWPELECGYGSIHLLVTLSATGRTLPVDNVPTTNEKHHNVLTEEDYSWYRLDNSWDEVGRLSVTVHGARGLSALGLSGKADAYCVLELDNSRVQTHTVRCSCEPNWNKTYDFSRAEREGRCILCAGARQLYSPDTHPTGTRPTTSLVLFKKVDAYCVLELDNSRVQTHPCAAAANPTGTRPTTSLGLSGKVEDAYCVLELDNSRVQTHTVHCSCEPNWNKTYDFGKVDAFCLMELDNSRVQTHTVRCSCARVQREALGFSGKVDAFCLMELDNSRVQTHTVRCSCEPNWNKTYDLKVDAYCVLELDNSRVQTHTVRCSCEPNWNKTYDFPVNDITSTLDITVYDESIITSMKGETLGKISIPLLRINNEEKRWYALKDRSKKGSARGNCPRILLEMAVVWNPIKASVRVLTPKETKYTQKPPKFDIPLLYGNLKFIKEVFSAIRTGNEYYKRVFEWDNREKNTVGVVLWLTFWYFFRLWMLPLVLLLPFLYNWSQYKSCNNTAVVLYNTSMDDDSFEDDTEAHKDPKTIKTRIHGLQDFTFTIKDSIDYICSVLERIKNLTTFTMPYLSYLAMLVLVGASVVLYFIPVNYLFMALGLYKYTRKILNPDRVPNNDLLDFISRLPDNEILKQWKELKVPEPSANSVTRVGSLRRR
ncbi:c2 domain-containing protein [Phthorimaea operculella]|nr:c2 domain-containing protein [Phthorimaea operculella]